MVAAVILVKFWFPDASAFLISAVSLAILFLLNYFSAKAFGESEFWFASIKVVTIVIFLVVGILMIFGIMGGQAPGLSNWTRDEAPFVNGFAGILSVFMIAGFSFQGTEIIGVAAGESGDPQKTIPRATRSVFWRILIFYLGGIFVVGCLLPYNDPKLLSASLNNLAESPFTLIFERAGFAAAASLMNAVILTSVLSCGNSGMYVASRMLYGLAVAGKAPKMFAKLSKHNIPLNALIFTAVIASACFLSAGSSGEGPVYLWLVNASGLAGFITWLGIALSHYRFRKGFLAQGHDLSELRYKSKLFPFGPLFALFLCLVVIGGQGASAFQGTIDWLGIAVAYIGLPFFLLLYFGYKIKHKTKVIPLDKIDLSGNYMDELAKRKAASQDV